MKRNRPVKKGRFLGIPYRVINSDPFGKLSGPENKLILDILLQYNGNNNGMLSPCFTLMKKRCWAKSSLFRAFSKLQHAGFLVVTRQGWKRRGKPTLVAVTWEGIDEAKEGVEYDPGIMPSHTPLSYWCTVKSCWKHKPKTKETAAVKRKFSSSYMEDKLPSYSSHLALVAS